MMSYKEWLKSIVSAVGDVASRKYQEEAWFPGGTVISSPKELHLILMEDCTLDLFFQTYGNTFTETQRKAWKHFRNNFEEYYDKLPKKPDPRKVLEDPAWELVRQSAAKFVEAFRTSSAGEGL